MGVSFQDKRGQNQNTSVGRRSERNFLNLSKPFLVKRELSNLRKDTKQIILQRMNPSVHIPLLIGLKKKERPKVQSRSRSDPMEISETLKVCVSVRTQSMNVTLKTKLMSFRLYGILLRGFPM